MTWSPPRPANDVDPVEATDRRIFTELRNSAAARDRQAASTPKRHGPAAAHQQHHDPPAEHGTEPLDNILSSAAGVEPAPAGQGPARQACRRSNAAKSKIGQGADFTLSMMNWQRIKARRDAALRRWPRRCAAIGSTVGRRRLPLEQLLVCGSVAAAIQSSIPTAALRRTTASKGAYDTLLISRHALEDRALDSSR